MPQVLSWNALGAQPAAIIDAAVRALKAGQLVGLPTESCYFLAGDAGNKGAVAKLQAFAEGKYPLPLITGVATGERPETALAGSGALARRIARRVWPGPVVIATAATKKEPASARYAPNSNSARQIMQAFAKPLFFVAPLDAQGKPAKNGEELAARTGNETAIVIEAGDSPFGDLPSLIEVDGAKYRIPFTGVVPKSDLAAQTFWLSIFVCTGNTCRSPLAEVMCKKALADKLGCEIEDLKDKGFRVLSMGLSALRGNTATPEALIVAREFKVDLSAHRSRSLMPEILELADHVIVMTGIHRDSILALHPQVESSLRLICGTGDLADPIGSDLEVYRKCAKTIKQQVDKLVAEMLASGVPTPF